MSKVDPPRYVVDSSSLIELKRSYPRHLFRPVWETVERLAEDRVIISCWDVLEELNDIDDELASWCEKYKEMFLELDEDVQSHVRRIMASHPGLVDFRKRKSGSDPFVVALAISRRCAVVSEEVLTKNPKRPKIPDVCRDYGIRCLKLLGLLEECGFSFTASGLHPNAGTDLHHRFTSC